MNKIILKATCSYFRWTCDICGELQEKDGMSSQIEDADICRKCLEAGPEGAIQRARLFAARLQKAADWLENEVPKVLRNVSPWLTGADYDAEMQERDKAIQAAYQVGEYQADEKIADAATDEEFPF